MALKIDTFKKKEKVKLTFETNKNVFMIDSDDSEIELPKNRPVGI